MATFMTGFSDTVGLLQSHFAVKKKIITEMRKLLSYWIKISEQEERKKGESPTEMVREKSQRLSKTGLKVHKVEQDGDQQARGKRQIRP